LADGRYLLLGSDDQKNYDEISKFSKKDAQARIEPQIAGLININLANFKTVHIDKLCQ
jgi:hypothetical protein